MVMQEVTLTLVSVTCKSCGCVFGLSEDMHQKFRKTHNWFYCPNGHQIYFPQKSDEEKLQEQLKDARARASHQQERAEHFREEWDRADRRRAAIKGHYTRMKNRIAEGQCPCCKQTFNNVRKHMQHKHPEMLEKLDQHQPAGKG
jgi:hypothetical protein